MRPAPTRRNLPASAKLKGWAAAAALICALEIVAFRIPAPDPLSSTALHTTLGVRPAAPPRADLALLLDRPLFDPSRAVPAKSPAPTVQFMPPPPPPRLTGTIVTASLREAIFSRLEGAPDQTLHEGETIGNTRILSIAPGHVLCVQDGVQRELVTKLQRTASADGSAPRPALVPPSTAPMQIWTMPPCTKPACTQE